MMRARGSFSHHPVKRGEILAAVENSEYDDRIMANAVDNSVGFVDQLSGVIPVNFPDCGPSLGKFSGRGNACEESVNQPSRI
jgi:hypothetical protein